MKIALRYGMAITVGVMVWTIIAHALVPNPRSPVHSFGAVFFFNALHFVAIFLGIRALERQLRDKPIFKQGVKIGVLISLVYAVSAALFFVGLLLFVGPTWLQAEHSAPGLPTWLIIVQAFAGLCGFAVLLGVVYSTLISFALAKRFGVR